MADGNLSTRQIARLLVVRAQPEAELQRLWLRDLDPEQRGIENVRYMQTLRYHAARKQRP